MLFSRREEGGGGVSLEYMRHCLIASKNRPIGQLMVQGQAGGGHDNIKSHQMGSIRCNKHGEC